MSDHGDGNPSQAPEGHPGRVLQQLMELHGIDRRQLHMATGMDIMRVYALLRGERAVSADTAVRLGTFFEQDAHYWLRLQADYDLKQVDPAAIARNIQRVSSNRWQQYPRQRNRAAREK